MSTQAATNVLSTKRRLERLERIAAIKSEGLLYSADVMQRFGVSNPTAIVDLRAAYGELPKKPAKPSPVMNKAQNKFSLGAKAIHCNFRMSAKTYEILQAGAASIGVTNAEAIRYAIVSTFLAKTEVTE